MFDVQRFQVFFDIGFVAFTEVHAVVLPTQRRMVTGGVRTSFWNKTCKGPPSLFTVESGQLSMIDRICLFVHTWYLTLYIVFNYPIALTSSLQPFRAICQLLELWLVNGNVTLN